MSAGPPARKRGYTCLDATSFSPGILRELLNRRERGYIAPTSLAVLYAGLGDTAEVYAWLRQGVEARDPFLVYNYVNDPIMAPFREDPRGQEILQVMGLTSR